MMSRCVDHANAWHSLLKFCVKKSLGKPQEALDASSSTWPQSMAYTDRSTLDNFRSLMFHLATFSYFTDLIQGQRGRAEIRKLFIFPLFFDTFQVCAKQRVPAHCASSIAVSLLQKSCSLKSYSTTTGCLRNVKKVFLKISYLFSPSSTVFYSFIMTIRHKAKTEQRQKCSILSPL